MKTTRILARTYDEMLYVLPPAKMATGKHGVMGFLVGEPTGHNEQGQPTYSPFFRSSDNDWYVTSAPMTVHEFLKAVDFLPEDLRDDEETPDNVQTELDLIEQYGRVAIDAYHALGIEQNYGLDDFEEAYIGEYSSHEDFAQQMAEDIGAIQTNVSWPYTCIDWELAARELMYDYSEENGHYFRNI